MSNEYIPGRPALPPAAWYPDPSGSGAERYWDGAQWTSQLRAPQYAPRPGGWGGGPNYAHWGWRLLAHLIDVALLSIVSTIVLSPLLADYNALLDEWQRDMMAAAGSGVAIPMPWDYPGFIPGTLLQAGLSLALLLVYSVTMLALAGATLGKMAVGVRVTPADRLDARRLGWGQAFVRQLAFGLLNYIPIFNIVNGLSPLWRARRQAFHDSMAKTVVIKTR